MTTVKLPANTTTTTDPATHERRNHTRHSIRNLAKIDGMEPDKLTTSITVQLHDISLGGIRFLTDQPLTHGAMWRLTILQNDNQAGAQALDIRSSQKIDDNKYLIGAQFITEPYLLAIVGGNPKSFTQEIEMPQESFQSVEQVLN